MAPLVAEDDLDEVAAFESDEPELPVDAVLACCEALVEAASSDEEEVETGEVLVDGEAAAEDEPEAVEDPVEDEDPPEVPAEELLLPPVAGVMLPSNLPVPHGMALPSGCTFCGSATLLPLASVMVKRVVQLGSPEEVPFGVYW